MKLHYSLIIASMAVASIGANAQSSIDAYQISSSDLRGTARFQAMGGAFTALGGDLSTMTQNPAGIGVYRSNEIGLSLDVDIQSAAATSSATKFTMDQTKVNFGNCSYVGSIQTGSELMPYFSWGFGYNRAVSFDRKFSGYCAPTSNSLSNYVAYFTNQLGYSPDELLKTDKYDPYTSDIDWMSILAYNSYLINPVDGRYEGLYQNGTNGDCSVLVNEKGRVDEYNIDFGGNFANTVYWGLGFGITDLSYTRYVLYDESMANARIPDQHATGVTDGKANFSLDNLKGVDGTGFNIKFGLIFRPINEFRIGAAIHTPTWYSLNTNYDAICDYDYTPNEGVWAYEPASAQTNQASFSWRLRSPWKFMFGAAGVLLNRLILSADYEYQAYQNMHIACPVYDNWGYQIGYQDYYEANEDISNYFQNANIVRLGAEFRALPWLSLRLGYNYKSSNVTDNAKYGNYEILTNGTDASYIFDNKTEYITAGIGIRYEAFYFDMAYVHKHLDSTWHAYTDYEGNKAPTCSVTNNNNKLVFSLGFKF